MSDQNPSQNQPQYGETSNAQAQGYQETPPQQLPAPQYAPPAGQPYSAPQYTSTQLQPQQSTNAFAIVALVTSIVGISIAGVIFGHLALSQIKKTGEKGHGMALAGLIVGYVGIGIGVLVTIFYILLIMGTIGAGIATSGSIS